MTTKTETDLRSHRLLTTVLIGIGAALAVAVRVFTSYVIAGVIAAVAFLGGDPESQAVGRSSRAADCPL